MKILSVLLIPLLLSGCVSASRYRLKEREARRLEDQVKSLSADVALIRADSERVIEEIESELSGLRASNRRLTETLTANASRKDSIIAELTDHRASLESEVRRLNGQAASVSGELTGMRERVAELDTENSRLGVDIEELLSENERLRQNLTAAEHRQTAECEGLDEIEAGLNEALSRETASRLVVLSRRGGMLVIYLSNAVLFDRGRSDLSAEGRRTLARIAPLLAGAKDRQVRIEGHTDNVPVTGALQIRFPTNWELSVARATNVARFLIDGAGLDGRRIVVLGYADTRPIDDNGTDLGRTRNRRIEIILAPCEPAGNRRTVSLGESHTP